MSSNYHLDQLGYLVLAAFDTLAYHPFEFEYKSQLFELPNDETDLDEFLDVGFIKLYQLKMAVGNRLKMIYDFRTAQVFYIELLSTETMPKGTESIIHILLMEPEKAFLTMCLWKSSRISLIKLIKTAVPMNRFSIAKVKFRGITGSLISKSPTCC